MGIEDLKALLSITSKAAFNAGAEILDVYSSEIEVEHKDDKSPLTEADKRSHLSIVAELENTSYPILSEEGRDIPYDERNAWDYFWMIDPLDGTKEFIKRNGEFTVNIALIHRQKAILGVIYVPVKDEMYLGAEGIGAYKIEAFSKSKEADIKSLLNQTNKLPFAIERPYTVVASRSHMSKETEDFITEKRNEVGEVEMISAGSSLKLCMVAEGKADAYPRFAPTMEWDTAAGQAIVEAAGGSVIDWTTKTSMKYNRENLLNNWFLVSV